MQHNAAQHLDTVRAHTQDPVCRFPHRGKSFRENIVFSFPVVQSLFEFPGFRLEFLIGQRTVFFFQRHNSINGFFQFLQFGLVSGTKNFFQKIQHPYLL